MNEAGALNIGGRWIGKRRVVRKIKEVHAETQALQLGHPEILPQGEVHVLSRRSTDAITRRVTKCGGIGNTAGR